MNELMNILDQVSDRIEGDCANPNIPKSERVLSVVSGGFVLGLGLRSLFKHPVAGLGGIAVGGMLIYRGLTGHCQIKQAVEKEQHDDVRIIEREYIVK